MGLKTILTIIAILIVSVDLLIVGTGVRLSSRYSREEEQETKEVSQ